MISKVFFALASCCLLSVVLAAPQHLIAGVVPIAPIAPIAPVTITSQYHSQDELGQYAYGYNGGPSAKHEVKTADGVTRGGYSYVDSYGLVQNVEYVADPVNGFRAAGTNFPVAPASAPVAPVVPLAPIAPVAVAPVGPAETPEVVAAKAAHFAAKAEAIARSGRRRRSVAYLPYAAPVAHYTPYAAPVAHYTPYAAPIAHYAPVAAPLASQYHSQDELGQYAYGYANKDSAKEEVKTADGITRGSYSYVDAHGLPQHVSYVSDPVNGFRAAGTNFPVAPASAPVAPVAPVIVA